MSTVFRPCLGWVVEEIKRASGRLSLSQGDSTANVRMDTANQETMDYYFSLLHQTLDKPSQICTVDET